MAQSSSQIPREMPGKRSEDVTQFTVRYPKAMQRRIDAIVSRLNARTPAGIEISVSDAMRAIVTRGVQELERELGIKPPKGSE